MSEATLDQLELVVESFEQARTRDDDTDLREFLPPPSDPNYQAVALELLRVDLESRWNTGSPRRLEEYREGYAEILGESERMAALAFEEYRCRVQAGEAVSPREYSRRFGIPTEDWPEATSLRIHPNDVDTIESIKDLSAESQRLVNSIQRFPRVGDQFAGFRLVERLGQGAFATVFLAREDDLAGRPVVLKVSSDASLEPQHLARLQHTNIVPIYSLHRSENLHAVCMPFFGRTTMSSVLRSLRSLPAIPTTGRCFADQLVSQRIDSGADADLNDDLPLEKLANSTYVDACVQLLLQLAEGLEHAHQRGILHRDIKPANVLVTDEGRPMLLDFNISDEIVVGGRSSLLVGGTLPYMSPEQRRAMITGAVIDQRSDVYSFGVLCHELLCGHLPATAESRSPGGDLNSLGPCQRVAPSAIRRHNGRIPASLAALVARCLHPDRDERYQSITDVREDLRRHLEHRPLRHVADRNPAERLGKWCRRHPQLVSGTTITAVALCAVLLLSGMLMVHMRRSRHYEAVALADSVAQHLPQLRVLFGAKELGDDQAKEGMRRIENLIANFHVGSDWASDRRIATLSGEQREKLRDGLAELCYLAAAHDLGQAGAEANSAPWKRARQLNQTARSMFDSTEIPIGLNLQQSALMASNVAPDGMNEVPANVTWTSNHRQMMFVQEMIARGSYGRAALELESLRQQQPLDFSTWFLLGNAYVAQARRSEAEGCFTTCTSLWPESYLGWFHRGLCRFESGQFQVAQSDFEHVLRLRDAFVPALFNRALCRKSLKDYQGAVDDLDQVIQLQGNRPRALLVRARIYELMGDRRRAEVDRKLALQSEPLDAKGWMARGLARVEREPREALDDMTRAQQIAPHQRDVQRNIAYVLGEHLDETEQAAELLSNLFQQFGQSDDLMAHAVMLARLGRRDAAISAGQRAMKMQRSPKLVFQMACVYALNSESSPDDISAAVRLLAEAIMREPHWLGQALTDSDLAHLRRRAEYRSMVRAAASLQRAARSVQPRQPPRDSPADVESDGTEE